LVLGIGAGAADAAFAQGRAALVNLDVVVIEPLAQTAPVLGRFVPRQTGVVAALTRGPVSKMLVDVGDRVAKGDVLVQLLTSTVRAERDLRAAELTEKEAALATAQAQLDVSQREFERLENLKKSAAFSQARFEDKRGEVAKYSSQVVEAEAAIARANANLRLASIELTHTSIRAPFDGVVAERHTMEGAYLNAGNAVVTLINDRDLEIEADIPSIRMSGVEVGRAVSVVLEDGSRHRAQVRAIVPSENVRTRTRPVRFSPFIETGMVDQLAANQSVTVLIPVGEIRDVVSVHKDAVVPRSDGAIVFVITDGRALLRRVRLGEAVGNRFEVLEGLAEGDNVVVRGNERLVPGQRVRWPGMPQSESSSSSAGGTSG
jgi:RND family efflux transporter MFP subunit